MNHTTRRTRTFIGMMVLAAMQARCMRDSEAIHFTLHAGLLRWRRDVAEMKVRLPGIEGSMSATSVPCCCGGEPQCGGSNPESHLFHPVSAAAEQEVRPETDVSISA